MSTPLSDAGRAKFKDSIAEQLMTQRTTSIKKAEEVQEEAKNFFPDAVTKAPHKHMKLFSKLFFNPADIGLPDFYMQTFQHLHKGWPSWVVDLVPEKISYQWNKAAVYSFCCNDTKHTQLVGKPGSGKTTLPQQVAARTGRPVIVQSFRVGLEEDDWLARQEISNEGTFLRKLPLVLSMSFPFYAVMDEFNRMSRGGRLLFNGVLHTGGHLRLPDGECVVPDAGWRCVTTDNTKGFGDGLDMFDGDVNDISTTDRFALMIEIPYLPLDQQVAMLMDDVPELHKELANRIILFGEKIAAGFNTGELPLPWTPRRATAAGELTMKYRNVTKALKDCYFSFMPEDKEKKVVNQLLKDVGIAKLFGEF